MENKAVKAQVKNVPASPQKLRLVINLVRGVNAQKALDMLQFLNKKGALHVRKAISSAIASAKTLHGIEAENLMISTIEVGEGKKQRKPRFGSRGRVSMLVKRKSHIKLELKAK